MDGRLLVDGERNGARRFRPGGAGRVLALPLLGVLLATGAAACTDSSSDNSKALDGWAQQVCDGLRDPVAQSRAALDDTAQVKQNESAADLQKRLSGDLGQLSTSNQQIADAMSKAGAPKIANGAGVQQDAVNELHQASQGFKDVQQKLTALPTNDQGKFADGLKSIGDQAQQLAKLSNTAMTTVQTGDLGKAFARQPGCRAAADASGSPAPNAAPSGSGSPAASTGASPGAPSSGSPAAGGSASGSPSGSPSAGGSPSGNGSGSPSGSASPS
ncbi:hypothetical protein E6W39_23490 [Kitasatospora acidiphila]|uniref:Small secreted protein n=1 Tax=Kitasatospora acidiphila TaxID=2567942 RepID=A0A540W6I6_9ACTN|nr:hypothetical protein [Kitasatospora acidiphila]TQF04642.1 hypothetical protein E6W39_23490 [Kitasatospora acidiphila]